MWRVWPADLALSALGGRSRDLAGVPSSQEEGREGHPKEKRTLGLHRRLAALSEGPVVVPFYEWVPSRGDGGVTCLLLRNGRVLGGVLGDPVILYVGPWLPLSGYWLPTPEHDAKAGNFIGQN